MMKKKVFLLLIVLVSAISCMEYESIELQIFEPANCFIVQKSGDYCFWAVEGRTYEPVYNARYVDVLWESFGTLEVPQKGDLIESVKYKDGMVKFRVPKDFKEGNAVIAVRGGGGDIQWSWHIWLVKDDIEEHAISAGDDNSDELIFMDRNLGATSAVSGLVTSNGLFYQFNRKDPFLGVGGVNGEMAESTYNWPEAEYSFTVGDSSSPYSSLTRHPTTFYSKIDYSEFLWSDYANPCPVGWTIPSENDWRTFFLDEAKIDFPLAGIKKINGLFDFGYTGVYWANSLYDREYDAAYYVDISKDYDYALRIFDCGRYGMSVRCVKE